MAVTAIDAATLRQWLDSGQAVLVDVREPAEHVAARIAQAHLLPLGQVALDRLPDHAGRKLVLHCLMGGRSATACERLVQEDPALEIHNLTGGIQAWAKAGFSVER